LLQDIPFLPFDVGMYRLVLLRSEELRVASQTPIREPISLGHPPSTNDYTKQEFADLIGFLRWAANGSQKEVQVSEIGELQ
jgi:hypothetical protein